MKNIVMWVTIIIFAFSTVFVMPKQKAEAAVPVAIAVGGGAAVGTYVVGGIAASIVVSGLGDTFNIEAWQDAGAAMNSHSKTVWSKSTQLAKDSSVALYNQALSAGEYVQGMPQDMIDYLAANASKIADVAVLGKAAYLAVTTPELFGNITYTGKHADATLTTSIKATGNFTVISQGLYGANASRNGSINKLDEVVFNYQSYNNTMNILTTSGEWISELPMSFAQWKQLNDTVMTSAQLSAFISGMGHLFYSTTAELWQEQAGISANIGSIELPRIDAGLVLPVNDMPFTATTPVTGVRVDPVTGATTVPNTATGQYDVPYSGDIVWSPSIPSPYTIPTTGKIGLSVPVTSVTGTTTGVTTGTDIYTNTPTNTSTPIEPPATTAPKPGDPINPFKVKPMPIAALTGLFQLLAALIFYLIRMFTFIATIALIAPTPIDNPYFLWFVDATFYGIKPFRLVQNLALFFLGFSVYRSVRRVFG